MQGHRVHMLELGDDALAARTRQHVHDLAAAHQRCLVIPLQLHAGAEGQWTERAAPCMLNNRLQQQRLCTSAEPLLKCRQRKAGLYASSLDWAFHEVLCQGAWLMVAWPRAGIIRRADARCLDSRSREP